MAVHSYRSLMRILERWANHGVPQMLASVLAAVAIGIGVTMLIDPSGYRAAPSFDLVFKWASPTAWGTCYILAAVAALSVVFHAPRTARLPVFMLGLVFSMQGLLVIPVAAAGAGLPSAIFTYIGMGWIALITQMVCGVATGRADDAQTAFHHVS